MGQWHGNCICRARTAAQYLHIPVVVLSLGRLAYIAQILYQAMPPLHELQRPGEEGNMGGQKEERRAVCLPSFCYGLFRFDIFNSQV